MTTAQPCLSHAPGAFIRALYPAESLQPLLNPRSIAVVGASARTASFGYRTLANLAGAGIPVYGVNSNRTPIDGLETYASVAELPAVPDCAVIAVPREAVEEAVLSCARAGIRGAIVFASGYAETGRPEHAELQARLTAISRQYGMRLLGPNCIGIVSGGGKLNLSFAEVPPIAPAPASAIGLVSQSGGLGFALAQASAHGYSFSHLLRRGHR
jgi:acetate---CoA ligase (ADP-forming)